MVRPSISQFILAIIVCTFLSGTGYSAWRTVNRHSQGKQPGAPECAFAGNQDLYGLGIRIGVYLQLLSTAFVDAFGNERDAASLGPTNLFFLIAFFIALVCTSQQNNLHAVEAYILISLGNGISWITLNGTIRLNPASLKEGGLAAMSRFLVWGIWKGYTSFFWWKGLDSLARSQCAALGWLFAEITLTGWFRILHKILNLVEWIAWGVGVMPYPFGVLILAYLLVRKIETRPIWKLKVAVDSLFMPIGVIHDTIFGSYNDANGILPRCENSPPRAHRGRLNFQQFYNSFYNDMTTVEENMQNEIDKVYERASATQIYIPKPAFRQVFHFRDAITALLSRTSLQGFPFLITFDIMTLLFTILTVELSVWLNNVQDVHYLGSSGQLIAFIVGLGSCLIALGQFYMGKLSGAKGLKRRARVQGQRVECGMGSD